MNAVADVTAFNVHEYTLPHDARHNKLITLSIITKHRRWLLCIVELILSAQK